MGLNINVADSIFELQKLGYIKDKFSAIDIGSQDLYFDDESLSLLLEGTKSSTKFVLPSNPSSASKFYTAIGCNEYSSIDLDGNHGSFQFDLNKIFTLEYDFHQQYDFIYNGGTSEHCFDQNAFFTNIHNLCKKDGIMYHVIPLQGGVNHGFINYHPYFFFKLAYVNNYKIEGIWLTSGSSAFRNLKDYNLCFEEFKLNSYDPTNNIMLYIAYAKTNNNQFVIPYQYDNEPTGWKNTLFEESFLRKFYELDKVNNVAIFGCGKASEVAQELCAKLNINILCHIDDFVTQANDNDINCVNRQDFVSRYSAQVDAILYGPQQKGDYTKALPSTIKKIVLDEIWSEYSGQYIRRDS